jgi:uncharacterized protein (TIGR03083 family)
MSQATVDAFRAEREEMLQTFKSLSDDEWNAPSDCAGWSNRDVLAHLASTLHGIADPSFMPDLSGGTESAMEAPVAERRGWPVEDVIAEYETYSAQAADTFEMLQGEGIGDTPVTMPELGTHPMKALAGCFLFDSYTHYRHDMLAPTGSVDRPQPARDEARLGPTIEWMLAGLPWMCEDALRPVVDRPIVLVLEGPGGGTWTIAPGGEEGRVLVTEVDTPGASATVRSGTHDFVVWGTTRRPYRDFVTIEGDEDYAVAFLDRVNII